MSSIELNTKVHEEQTKSQRTTKSTTKRKSLKNLKTEEETECLFREWGGGQKMVLIKH